MGQAFLSIAQLKNLQQHSAKPESTASPTDTARVSTAGKYRDPREAISFMNDFDGQLGLSEEMKAEKRALMAESPHAFYKASPALFYHDLHGTYKEAVRLLPDPAPTVTIVGDSHAFNAGTFRGPEGKVVWGLNDFDQAEHGSPEWDLARLGVSLYVSARNAGESAEESLELVKEMGEAYLKGLNDNAPPYMDKGEAKGEIDDLIDKAADETHQKLLDKWTVDGTKLKRNEKLVEPEPERGNQVKSALAATFPEYQFLDTASKPHSGGSTRGLERYYSLVRSPEREDPWILETKAVLPSPVQKPDGDLSRGDGEKVLEFWRKMGGHVDQRHRAFKIGEVAFFTREREKEKDSLDEKPDHLEASAEYVGKMLARSHAESGADIEGWVGEHKQELVRNLSEFSRTYARQVESDFRAWRHRYGEPAGKGGP